MFNGYFLAMGGPHNALYINTEDTDLIIRRIICPALYGKIGDPIEWKISKIYKQKCHNLSGPASIIYSKRDNNKCTISRSDYYIADNKLSKENWMQLVKAIKSDKLKTQKELEDELYKNYDKCLAYLIDQNAINIGIIEDYSIREIKYIKSLLQNEEAKENIDQLLVLKKLCN